MTAGDSLAAVNLGCLEVLRTQPLLINRLDETQRGEDREVEEEEEEKGEEKINIIS